MLPADDKLRKQVRAYQGFVKYFPDAIALVAILSKVANEQHNPGTPMHWAKEKSKDELDSLMNHLMDVAAKGELSQDGDGILDAVKIAWRGMANLQRLADTHGLETLMRLMLEVPEEGVVMYECLTEGCDAACEPPRVRCDACIEARNLDTLLRS